MLKINAYTYFFIGLLKKRKYKEPQPIPRPGKSTPCVFKLRKKIAGGQDGRTWAEFVGHNGSLLTTKNMIFGLELK